MERKITPKWAFEQNGHQLAIDNEAIYQDLINKYSICGSGIKKYIGKGQYEPIGQDKYDVIYECTGTGYGYRKYKFYKNAPKLTWDEMALICDRGNLCFGYANDFDGIRIYTD